MKYIVPTYMRVGSTLVSETLSYLTGEPETFVEGSVDDLLQAEGIVKTHSRYAVDFLEPAKTNKNFHIVYTFRNFKDAIVSRLLYEKNVRTQENLPLIKPVELILSTYDNIDDKAFLDLIIETNLQWLQQEAFRWKRATTLILHPQFTRVNYDNVADDLDSLVELLGNLVKASDDKRQFALNKIQFSKMQARHIKGFLRTGRVGDHKNMLNSASIARLDKVIATAQTKPIL